MRDSRYLNVAETEYPAIRRVMPFAGDHLDDDQLEAIVESRFPGAETEDVENFMRTMQQFGKTIAPLAQKALPGIVSGAAQGAALGPYGALVGAVGGGAASLLSGGGQTAPSPPAPAPAAVPPPPAPPPAAVPATAPVSAASAQPGAAAVQAPAPPATPPGAPAAPAAAHAQAQPTTGAATGGAPSDLAAQLLALLSSRKTADALLGMLMADNGRKTVTVANRAVPAPAFANAIAEVAAELAGAAGAWPDNGGSYLTDPQGNPRADLPNPRARAALLLSDLADSIAADEGSSQSEEDVDFADADPSEGIDAIDAYEAALEGQDWS